MSAIAGVAAMSDGASSKKASGMAVAARATDVRSRSREI